MNLLFFWGALVRIFQSLWIGDDDCKCFHYGDTTDGRVKSMSHTNFFFWLVEPLQLDMIIMVNFDLVYDNKSGTKEGFEYCFMSPFWFFMERLLVLVVLMLVRRLNCVMVVLLLVLFSYNHLSVQWCYYYSPPAPFLLFPKLHVGVLCFTLFICQQLKIWHAS